MARRVALSTLLSSSILTSLAWSPDVHAGEPPVQRPTPASQLEGPANIPSPLEQESEPTPDLAPAPLPTGPSSDLTPSPTESDLASAPSDSELAVSPPLTEPDADPELPRDLDGSDLDGSERGDLPGYASPITLASDLDGGEADTPVPESDGVEVPRAGQGLMAVGSLTLVGGAVLVAGSPILASGGYTPQTWAAPLSMGVIVMGAGSLLVGVGHRRHQRYQRWVTAQPTRPPAQGYGLAASGGLLLTGGAIMGTVSCMGLMLDNIVWFRDRNLRPIGFSALGIGIGAIATGAVLISVGVQRNKRFHRWRRPERHPVDLSPTVSPITGGVQLGLAGRF